MRIKQIAALWLLLTLFSNEAHAALALDCGGGACPTASGTNAATLSTTNTNDTVCAVFGRSSTTLTTGVTDTAGLTYTQRAYKKTGSSNIVIEMWCAFSSGALTNDVITGACSGCSNRTSAFAISGADTSSQFDANASIPCTNGTTSSTSDSCTISTNTADNFLIALDRLSGSPGTITPPSGFTQIVAAGTNQYMAYKIVASTQSSVAETFTSQNSVDSSVIIDAVKCTSCAGGGGGGTNGSGSPGFLFGTGF